MDTGCEHRSFQRIDFGRKVKLTSMGMLVVYAAAINLGAGGVLLKVATVLPVGEWCRIELSRNREPRQILAEGTVVRSGTGGTAIQFADPLDQERFTALIRQYPGSPLRSIVRLYQAYFLVSRDRKLADCERLLGVTKRQFRTIFAATFTFCSAIAILPIWIFHGSLSIFPDWIKVGSSFVYATIWLGFVQPTVDLAVFRYVRRRGMPGRTR